LDVSITEESKWKRTLHITVPEERLETTIGHVYDQYQKELVIPGFRKGKVRKEVLKAYYGEKIEEEALDKLTAELIEEAVREKELNPITVPEITKKREPGAPLEITATFEVQPSVTPKNYTGLELVRKREKVSDDDIDNALRSLQKKYADHIKVVDRNAINSDILLIEEVPVDEEGNPLSQAEPKSYRIELGSEYTRKEFNEKLHGAAIGQPVFIEVTYPEDFVNSKLRNRTAHYMVTIREINEQKLPVLDDAFATKVDESCKTFEELRKKIHDELEKDEEYRSLRELRRRLVDVIIEKNPFELPDSMVQKYLDDLEGEVEKRREYDPEVAKKIDEGTLRKELLPLAEKELKEYILLEKIRQMENISLSKDELKEEIARRAETIGQNERDLRSYLIKSGRMPELREELERNKLFEFLLSTATIIDT
jgi:trigger factor